MHRCVIMIDRLEFADTPSFSKRGMIRVVTRCFLSVARLRSPIVLIFFWNLISGITKKWIVECARWKLSGERSFWIRRRQKGDFEFEKRRCLSRVFVLNWPRCRRRWMALETALERTQRLRELSRYGSVQLVRLVVRDGLIDSWNMQRDFAREILSEIVCILRLERIPV